MYVHSWGKEYVAAVFKRFVADTLTDLLDQFLIPGTSECCTYRETGTVVGVVVVLTGRGDAYASRSVGEYCGRYTQTWDGLWLEVA